MAGIEDKGSKGVHVDQAWLDAYVARGGIAHDVATGEAKKEAVRDPVSDTPIKLSKQKEQDFEKRIHVQREDGSLVGKAEDILKLEAEHALHGKPGESSPDPDLLDAVLGTKAGSKSKTPKAEKLHKQAIKQEASPKEPTNEQLAREKKQRETVANAETTKTANTFSSVASGINETITEKLDPVASKIAAMPTPGGVGMLVAILLIMLWTIIPANANGDTRLKLLWYTLGGRTQLAGAVAPIGGDYNSQQGKDFSNIVNTGPGTGGASDFSGVAFAGAALTPVDTGFRTITGGFLN